MPQIFIVLCYCEPSRLPFFVLQLFLYHLQNQVSILTVFFFKKKNSISLVWEGGDYFCLFYAKQEELRSETEFSNQNGLAMKLSILIK